MLTKYGTAKIRPRARLIGLIGEELISDEPVALVELVKNSYDADASVAKVKFEGSSPEQPNRIIISDDGIGMSLETVLGVWLEPGTPAKRRAQTSSAGRVLQGAKGIGRFAAARLAESLILETKAENSDEVVLVILNWGAFDEDSYLEDVDIEYETVVEPDRDPGTILTLENVRSKDWTEEDYTQLYDRLSRLISPFDDIQDFLIDLQIPGYPQYSGNVQPPDIILKPRYILKGDLDSAGFFSGQFVYEDEVRVVWNRDKLSEKEKANLPVSVVFREKLKRGNKNEYPICGSFEIEIRAWDRDREGLESYTKLYDRGIREIRNILDRYSGVSIYRDGFRVYPYGQSGNDWLNLDNRSRQTPARHLANNQIVGAIRISREGNPELVDRSNREGMVINEAHKALENWFIEVLSILEEERYKLRPRKTTITPGVNPIFEVFDLSTTVASAKSSLGENHPLVLELVETAAEITEGVERVQDVFSRLLLSSGLGQMVDIVIHEIGRPLGSINRRIVMLENAISKDCSDTERIGQNISSIKGALEDLHNLRERLNPHTPAKRGRAESFNVIEEIRDNFALFETLISRQSITVDILGDQDRLNVRMSRSSLSQILSNLIDNSIFWLVRSKGVGKGGRINVEVIELENGFKLLFSDDGPGVTPEDQVDIFEPYFSRKPRGSGLGLYIARLVVEPYGKLVYRDDCTLRGACFEVTFEKSVGK